LADPEQDGELTYWACHSCLREWGYQLAAAPAEDSCQLGIPESARKAVSAVGERAQATLSRNEPVFLQLGRRP
jgi:hypothetical protein